MKKLLILTCLILLFSTSFAQQNSTSATKVDLSYFITHTREELISKLVDQEGKIIASAHNSQIQKRRSDLHAEMTLLTNFEKSFKSRKYMNSYVYKPGMIVFSSAEPCPMCFIRIITTGCDTKYCTPGPEDGMVSRISYLPAYWKEMAMERKVELGNCSPEMQKLSHLLFYS